MAWTHPPAGYVRRPDVPAESPALGLTHLQFEAVLTTARHSTNVCGFALVTMLGLVGPRILGATGSDLEELGEEHGHRVLWNGRSFSPGRWWLPGRSWSHGICSIHGVHVAGPRLDLSIDSRCCVDGRSRR